MSNKGLNSNEALEESTATNSSVTLSGIRRAKETPEGLNIEDYTPDHRKYRRARVETRAPLARRDGLNQRKSKRGSGVRYIDVTRWFVLAIGIGLAIVGFVSADDNVRALKRPHLTILAGSGTTSYGA